MEPLINEQKRKRKRVKEQIGSNKCKGSFKTTFQSEEINSMFGRQDKTIEK